MNRCISEQIDELKVCLHGYLGGCVYRWLVIGRGMRVERWPAGGMDG